MDLNALLSRVIEIGGSDLHLKIASPAVARIDGRLEPIDERVLSDSDLEACLQLVTSRTPAKREHFYAMGELGTAYIADTVGRFRANGYRQRGSISWATNRHNFEIAIEHALKETSAAERGGLRTVDTPGDGEKPTRLRLASP